VLVMAKLVSVCRSENYPFEQRQIPLVVDDKLTMVMQFEDSCIGCNHNGIKQKDLERFLVKFRAFTPEEVSSALRSASKDVLNLLAQMVPCVGCRRSVERLFHQLVKSGHPALEPLVISSSSYLSIKPDYLDDPKALYSLFYVHGNRLNVMMDSIPKSKKNKRCILHSLDTHKVKALATWMDIWEVMSSECREEVILVECDQLMITLENYLRKHRFCTECKAKVLRAYDLLINEKEAEKEKGYCPTLYENLRCCPGEKHIHVSSKTDYIANLIGRAEPELMGSRRERHAKTLDIAQEEVLTCIGIHLYERLHKIWQKMRAEEQTWQILFYVGVDALKKSFELALERKQGVSNLELMCQELLEEEAAQEVRREQKRQKKRGKKKASKASKTEEQQEDEEEDEEEVHEDLCKDKENCQCRDENTNLASVACAACDDHVKPTPHQNNNSSCQCDAKPRGSSSKRCGSISSAGGSDSGIVHQGSDDCGAGQCDSDCNDEGCGRGEAGCGRGRGSDGGYSSETEGCDSCSREASSQASSQDGSDQSACESGVCNNGDSPLCKRVELQEPCHCSKGKYNAAASRSLLDMLEASGSSGDDDEHISEEEIQRFRANAGALNRQREELRATLRQRFAKLACSQGHGNNCPPNCRGRVDAAEY